MFKKTESSDNSENDPLSKNRKLNHQKILRMANFQKTKGQSSEASEDPQTILRMANFQITKGQSSENSEDPQKILSVMKSQQQN